MAKDEAILAGKNKFLQGQDQVLGEALGSVYDQALIDNPPGSGGGLSQADLDAAVASAVGPLNEQILGLQAQVQASVDKDVQDEANLKAAQDAKAEVDAALLDLHGQLDGALAAKSASEEVIKGLKDSADKLQAMVDAIHALFPAPPPPPPVEPAP